MKLKKLNSKGFSHVEALIAIVMVLAIGGIALLVNNHGHKSSAKSHALGYTVIASNDGYSIQACKTYESTGYGPIYQVNFLFYKPSNVPNSWARWYAADYRPSNGINNEISYQQGYAYLYNTVAGALVNAAPLLGDKVFAQVSVLGSVIVGSYGDKLFNPAVLTNC